MPQRPQTNHIRYVSDENFGLFRNLLYLLYVFFTMYLVVHAKF